MSAFRPCVLIPTYDNPETIERVVVSARDRLPHVIVVDDGSGPEGRAACASLAERGLATVVHRAKNGGKGAAVKTGLDAAHEAGFTHALQIDADGQHDLEAMETFLAAAESAPGACILGYPVYGDSVPALRLRARKITSFWVDLEVGGRGIIRDAMVGFRVYPVESIRALRVKTDRMDFDVEIAVRVAWSGIPIQNLPVGVRYLTAEEGGRSHFQPLRDNLRLGLLHSRLCTEGSIRAVFRWLGLRRLLGAGS
jgi:polyprenyl-phospho-N-acetylgalactosaminyl synthase